ncbi:hypothetical protein PRIPAC_94878, partial [Pristionchus pacificus]|uniref:Uncharacterized protein n=1 Tax=Pristionchus pacificus TaxID=54126 RepID=A0A2A6CDX3_PRIPA
NVASLKIDSAAILVNGALSTQLTSNLLANVDVLVQQVEGWTGDAGFEERAIMFKFHKIRLRFWFQNSVPALVMIPNSRPWISPGRVAVLAILLLRVHHTHQRAPDEKVADLLHVLLAALARHHFRRLRQQLLLVDILLEEQLQWCVVDDYQNGCRIEISTGDVSQLVHATPRCRTLLISVVVGTAVAGAIECCCKGH